MTISCPCMEINKSNRYLPWRLFLCKNLIDATNNIFSDNTISLLWYSKRSGIKSTQ